MPFKLVLKPRFEAPVTVHAPGGRGAAPEQFAALFEALPIDEFSRFDLATSAGTRAFLEAALVGASDVTDEAGQPLPDGPELRAVLINLPHVRQALVEAYIAGLDGGRLGN